MPTRNVAKNRLLFGRQVAADSLVQSGKPVAKRLLKKRQMPQEALPARVVLSKKKPTAAQQTCVVRAEAAPAKTGLAQVFDDVKAFFSEGGSRPGNVIKPDGTRLMTGDVALGGIAVFLLVIVVLAVWLWGLSRSGQEAFNREGENGFASTQIWFALTFLFGIFCPPLGVTLGVINLVQLGASPRSLQ